jgi:hypothetical protein
MTPTSLFGILTIVALGLVLVFATIAFVYTNRLLNRKSVPMSEEIRWRLQCPAEVAQTRTDVDG